MLEKAVETEKAPQPIARLRGYILWYPTQPSELCLSCVSDWHRDIIFHSLIKLTD